ncbi:Hypothetical protein NGAL_HAMBI1145_09580 [Neorhizobium galegae bv. officinalis]|uniref:Pentapeptide repeat-containing protein n=2 Tax=Neorhizobium galegae TaxID=399 RepID=A0A0T7FAX6_NEOGA|nr:Hypothetical protein NGAL_HAMBI1145_09580 [Neorhizobium galegae bv. officinalis]
MRPDEDDNKVLNGPTDNENTWLIAAIVTFAFAVVAFGFGALWTFSREGQDAVYRAQTFAPFGVAIGAVVTFFTVVWRGILSTKQLNLQAAQLQQQIDQLSQVIRQNDAKEDENLVKLLQEGAKFITENEKQPQVMAGIASLDVLISNDVKRKYSIQAMDILAGYYHGNFLLDNDTVRNARRALNRAAESGVSSTIDAAFSSHDDAHQWPTVRGFASQWYTGGRIDFTTLSEIRSEARSFERVSFYRCEVWDSLYEKCQFRKCEIKSFDLDFLEQSRFEECDFSGCKFGRFLFFDDEWPKLALKLGKNFYYADDPPTFKGRDSWRDVLIEKPATERPQTPF